MLVKNTLAHCDRGFFFSSSFFFLSRRNPSFISKLPFAPWLNFPAWSESSTRRFHQRQSLCWGGKKKYWASQQWQLEAILNILFFFTPIAQLCVHVKWPSQETYSSMSCPWRENLLKLHNEKKCLDVKAKVQSVVVVVAARPQKC